MESPHDHGHSAPREKGDLKETAVSDGLAMVSNWKPRPLWQRLLLAPLLIATASAFRLVFFASLGESIPYLLYFPAVTLVGLYGGLLAGLLATMLSAGMVLFWINQGQMSPPEWLAMVVFVISGVLISFICETMHRGLKREQLARAEAEAVSQKLRIEMAERQQAQAAMIASEMRYRRLFEAARDGVLILNAETGMVVDVNPYLIELLGVTREVFLGRKVWELGFFKDVVANEANFLELQQKQYIRYENMALEGHDGKRHEVEFVSNVYLVDGHKVIQCNIRDISERVKAKEKIKRTMADLERSNQELEHFAYVASHDLQEPLRMVASYTQLLEQHFSGQLDDKARKYIHYTVDGAVRMQTLINDLLAYSRVGRRGKPLEPTDAHAVLGEAIRNLAATIQETHAVITSDDLPTVTAEVSQLVLLFQNLLSNAIKFRRNESPRIHVSARRDGSEWVFAVQDNGIGIEAQYAERVFVLFQRLHTKEEYPGTGMGLAICKRIVERHGGKIWFESSPGRGTTFFFTIPANQPKQAYETH